MTGTPPRGRIRILDTATVNRIAGGEVVERPSSVVKELVENAVDADASRILIEVISAHGAVSSIRVTDNGTGMPPEDALLAFVPHSTSKIREIGDIDTVTTLGFRGEALSSIAAIARVTLITRERGTGALSGTKVVIEGGEVRERAETGAPEGTGIFVEDLFFNTPARKKFQKSLQTEIAQIIGVTEGIGLAHPEIRIRCLHNGKELLATDGSAKLGDAIARICGAETAALMIPVRRKSSDLSIEGFVSVPSAVRKTAGRILIAINRRPVSSQTIVSALLEGYGTLIPKGRYPVAFLSLSVDPRSVDVNVHPAKKIVRIGPENGIRSAVSAAVREALRAADLIPSPTLQEGEKGDAAQSLSRQVRYDHRERVRNGVSEATHAGTRTTERQLRQTEITDSTEPARTRIPEMDLIGQYGGIYLIAATAAGDLIVIDQHAAHERILYEQVSARNREPPVSQELIEPVVIDRAAKEAAVLRSLLPILAGEGFTIGEFGRNSFIVTAIPVVLGKTDEAAGLVADIVDELTGGKLNGQPTRREEITRIIACRGAIKAGTVCTGEQCRRLLQQLARTTDPHTCPHGRPTMIRFSREQLDHLFRRT